MDHSMVLPPQQTICSLSKFPILKGNYTKPPLCCTAVFKTNVSKCGRQMTSWSEMHLLRMWPPCHSCKLTALAKWNKTWPTSQLKSEMTILQRSSFTVYPGCAACTESARSVTGRRCPHSGVGRDFLARNGPNRTKMGITRKRNERFGWAQRLNRANAEGYKRPVDKNRGPISKNGLKSGIFGPKKNVHFWILTMFRPRPGGLVKRKKYPFPK